MSIDGTPISAADRARMETEEALLAQRQRQAVWAVAAGARDVADARLLLDILGLDVEVVRSARTGKLGPVGGPAAEAAAEGAAHGGVDALSESETVAAAPDARGRSSARPRKRTAA